MSSSPEFSAEQLAAARSVAWHQDGRALETLESARSWIDHYGFVLFAPRAEQLGAPAPSFIEATLGVANQAPTAAESTLARSLAARLVAEGSVIPLNLLGAAGDAPDFLASAKVFSYVFTMRGDKAWKQPPSTSEGAKVSPLALRVYEVLQEKGALSAAELATALGREVTVAAIQRSLNELWGQLRVLPQMQPEGGASLWELASARFAKAIKAGANAGQPSAMSALLSLYLGQAIGATEEEVAGFLSPLTARSRVREVLNALTTGRQLETTVVEGRTLLHVAGALPEFPAVAKPEGEATEPALPVKAPKVGTGRITRFEAGTDRKPRADFKGKPARTFAARSASPRTTGARPSRPPGARPDTERRPFKRNADGAAGKPSFTRPWDEDKRPRRADTAEAEGGASAPPRERKNFGAKPPFAARKSFGAKSAFGAGKSFDGPRKPFGDRKSFGAKPAFGAKPGFGPKPSGDRPSRPRAEASSSGSPGYPPRERAPYPRREGAGSAGRKPAERRPYERKPYERKPFVRRDAAGADTGARPPRSFDKPRTFDKPRSFDKPRTFGAGAGKPGGFSKFNKPAGERKPFRKREENGESTGRTFAKPSYAKPGYAKPSFERSSKPRSGGASRPGFAAKAAFGAGKPRFGAGARPAFGASKTGARPASKFGAKSLNAKPFGAKPFAPKSGSKSFGVKPVRPFARRDGGVKPTLRKPKPETEE